MEKKRVLYWDVIKCIAIFLVVWGHSIQFLQLDIMKCMSDPVAATIISFHMPLFMMVSGYFALSVFKVSTWDMVKKKSRQLLLPSISIYFIIGLVLIFIRQNDFSPAFKSLLKYCCGSFWFLKALFIYYILACVFINLWRRSPMLALGVFIVGGGILPVKWLNYVHCISMFPYFVIGIFLHKYETFFLFHRKEIFIVSLTIYLILTYFYPTQEYDMYTHLFQWKKKFLFLYLLRTMIGTLASFAVIILIREISLRLGDNALIRFLAIIGTYTLGIYIIHTEINQFCHQYLLSYISVLNPYNGGEYADFFFDYAICLPASALIIVLCVLSIKIIRINKYTKLILLGEK